MFLYRFGLASYIRLSASANTLSIDLPLSGTQ